MIAYHGEPALRDAVLRELDGHAKADRLMRGTYWTNGRGCAVGCLVKGSYHSKYPRLFGIPTQLAYLEDQLFETQSGERWREWPVRFMGAIQPGADLSQVWDRWALWLLDDFLAPCVVCHEQQRAAVAGVADLYRSRLAGIEPSAAGEAWAARAARAAGEAWAARAAREAWEAWAAAGAARAAWAAAAAAAAAAEAREARAARAADIMADKLIELLQAAPIAADAHIEADSKAAVAEIKWTYTDAPVLA